MQDWLHLSDNLMTNIPKLFCLSLPLRLHCLKKNKNTSRMKGVQNKIQPPTTSSFKSNFPEPWCHFLSPHSLSCLQYLGFWLQNGSVFSCVFFLVVFFFWLLLFVCCCWCVCVCVCVKRTVFETLSMYFPLSLQYAISDVKVITRAE